MDWLLKLCKIGFQSTTSESSLACAVIGVVEAALHSAGGTGSVSSFSESNENRVQPVVPFINWTLCEGLHEILSTFLEQCLMDFATYYFDKRDYSAIKVQQHIELLITRHLLTVLKSHSLSLALQYVRQYSILLYEGETKGTTEIPHNLPSFGSLVGPSAASCPVLHDRSTIHFVLAVLRLMLTLGKLNRSIVDMTYHYVLSHDETLQYMRRVCQLPMFPLAANHFSMYENHLQFYLISMARLECIGKESSVEVTGYHKLALSLLTRLQPGDEHLAHDLLSYVIFGVDFLRDITADDDRASTHFDEVLRLDDRVPLSNATQQSVNTTAAFLKEDLIAHLASLRATYLQVAPVTPQALIQSRHSMLCNSQDVQSLLSGVVGQLLVPLDWVFLPLVGIYEQAIGAKSDGTQQRLQPGLVALVTNVLRAVYLLECWRASSLACVSALVKLSRLMCTFLAGSDLFLDVTIHQYLAALLRNYSKPVQLDRLNFKQAVPGLASFFDFYVELVNQYEAVSFGDSLFACYVLLPLQREHNVLLRKTVWGEHSTVLRCISIPIAEMMIPMGRFLEPDESDVELLKMYLEGLLNGSATALRSPVMYLIGVHHVNRFIYAVDSADRYDKYTMIRQITGSKDERLRLHLLHYKRYNVDCEFRMELYDVLPSLRQATLEAAAGNRR